MENPDENLTLKEFVELLDYLDDTIEGQNLRFYPDGSSYITNDDGIDTEDFDDIYKLVIYLKELKRKFDTGELVAVDRS